jgi:hypothetical protein
VRSLAPELLPTGTTPRPPHPSLPTDADAWSSLAADIAEATDRAAVADAVVGAAATLGVDVDADAELIVLQRTFGRLHRRAAAVRSGAW